MFIMRWLNQLLTWRTGETVVPCKHCGANVLVPGYIAKKVKEGKGYFVLDDECTKGYFSENDGYNKMLDAVVLYFPTYTLAEHLIDDVGIANILHG
jgi:hypothetical protein